MSSILAPRSSADVGRAACLRATLRRVFARASQCAFLALATAALVAAPAHAQFVQGGTLVPGPSSSNFPLWGTIASPASGVTKVDDLKDIATGGNATSNFARLWIALGTQLGGSTAVSASDTIQYVYIRIDHKGTPEEATNFNMQLNLGGAPAGRVDHLLTLRPIFSGPDKPFSGRVRIALKRYSTDAGGNYPLLGAFTTSSFVSGADIDNVGSPAEGVAIGWEGVATDGFNGFEVRIPAAWFHGDASRLVQPDGSGVSAVTTALFSTGGSFGAVATVRDYFADAAGNNLIVKLSTTTGTTSTVVGTKLAYGTQPAAANAYATLGAFTVVQQNADGTTVSGGTASISLAIASGPVGGAISGTPTRSASSGTATFNDISFAKPGTYTLTATSTGLLGATSSSFVISAVVAPAPTITGITTGNAQLSVAFTAPANDGGSAITTYQYSTNNGTSWTTRATGTTASPLVITGLTNGTTYPVRIRAVNGVGNGAQSNAVSATPSAPAPPANTVVPAVTGTTTVAQTLTTSTGTWSGSPTPTYAYQWQRCDAAGNNCVNLAGETSSTYTLVSNDAGSTMRAVVTATNASGSASGSSAQTAVIAQAPANTVAPTISGSTVSGQLLTAATGTWTGTPTPTYGYQWQRCDAAGGNCTSIATATASTYTLTDSDAGGTIRVVVTGTNAVGSASATAAQTATITAAPFAPSNTGAPAITGTTTVGQLLTATTGTWIGFPAPTFTYQWRRCDAAGNNCADVSGETAATYTLTSTDAGATMRVVVTGTNASGNASGTSSQTAAIASPPANTAPPTISGTATIGQLLTSGAGTWTGYPTPALTYQWRRCDASGSACVDIAGATSSTYTLTSTDAASTIRVVETGTNSAGNASATSTQTGAVATAPVAPANTVAPAITGTSTVGQLLSATTGSWTGYPAPTYTYQWRRCDSAGNNCTDISGETTSTYTLGSGDAGNTIRVVVTGTNASGSATSTSTQAGPVALAPANTVAPSISGTTTEGQQLSAAIGTWTGSPTPTYTYDWQRCDASGNACTSISGATSSTYTLTSADVGATIRVAVTGTNIAGTATATATQSAQVIAAPAAPANSSAPTITGTTTVGQLLTAVNGSWTGTPAPTLTHQWQRCDLAGSNCSDIAGQTAATYTLTTTDAGSTIRVVETGTNATSSASASSAQTTAVNQAPANTVLPAITGTTTQGQSLSASTGTWTGYPTATLAYQWQRCDNAGANCSNIASATSSSYLLTATDVAATLRVVVTGTNVAGSASATATQSAVIAAAGAAPANGTLPTIGGTTAVGQLLTVTPGMWTGTPSPTLAYQWQRCDLAGANCTAISGATSATYTLVSADAGSTVRVVETGTNSSGSASATSTQTSAVNLAPANTVAPSITGTMTEGQLLTGAAGSWTGYPTPTLAYQWQRCDASGASCVDVSGATTSTYTLAAADVGKTMRVKVTGTNASGSAAASSTQTAVATALPTPPVVTPPVATTPPTIAGAPVVGAPLTADPGTWALPDSTTVQWRRCDASGNDCRDIPGATGRTYTPGDDDAGAMIQVVVTSTTTGKTQTTVAGPITAATPSATSRVFAPPPSGVVTPTVSPSDSIPADGTRYAVIRIELFDANGRPITKRGSSDFTVTIDGVAVATTVRETSTPGVYELEVRSSTVNQVTIRVAVNGVLLKDAPTVRFVQATANLDIKLAASTDTPAIGQTVVFTVDVKNLGPNSATGVEVEQKLSARVRYVSSTATRGAYDDARGVWTLGNLALGETATLKITVTVIK